MSATRFVRRPEFDLPICTGCSNDCFPTKAYIDLSSGQLFRVPDGPLPSDFFDEPEQEPEEQLDLQLDDIPLILPCGMQWAD